MQKQSNLLEQLLAPSSIPEDWQITSIGSVTKLTRKPRQLRVDSFEHIPFIPMELVPDNALYLGDYVLKKPESLSSGTYCETGDFLLAKITPSFENGKQGILTEMPNGFAYATTEVFPLKVDELLIDSTYLFFYFSIPQIRRDIAAKMEGSTGRQRVPKSIIDTYPILLPPLPEQKRIVGILKAAYTSVSAHNALIKELYSAKQSFLKYAFTFGNDATPAITRQTEIGEIPEEWATISLGEGAEFLQYGTSERAERNKIGVAVLRIPNVVNEKIDTSELKYIELPQKVVDNLCLEIGDILFVRTNGRREYTGRCAVYQGVPEKTIFASYLIRIRLKPNLLLSKFVQAFCSTEMGRSQLSGKASPAADGKFNINTQTIKQVVCPLPDISKQAEIVKTLGTFESKISTEEARRDALQTLFESALYELMTGQIRLLSDEGLPYEQN